MKRKVSLFLLLLGLLLSIPVSAECQHNWEDWSGDSINCGCEALQLRTCLKCYQIENRVVPATGNHQWGDWQISSFTGCTNHVTEIRYCNNCVANESRTLPSPGHEWSSWYTAKEATAFSAGKSERECSVCYETESKTIAKLKTKKASTKTEKSVTKTISNFFNYAKKYNTSQIKKCFKNPSKVKLFTTKKNMAKFYKTYNKKYLKYAYKSIKVSKKTATVKVYCRYYDAYYPTICSIDDMVSYIYEHPKASSNTIDKRQYKKMCSYAKKEGVVYDNVTITFKLVKSGSSWKISSFTKAMDNAIHGNYRDAYNDYFD